MKKLKQGQVLESTTGGRAFGVDKVNLDTVVHLIRYLSDTEISPSSRNTKEKVMRQDRL